MTREYLVKYCIFYAFGTVFHLVPFLYVLFYETGTLTREHKILIGLASLISMNFALCIFFMKLLVNKKFVESPKK